MRLPTLSARVLSWTVFGAGAVALNLAIVPLLAAEPEKPDGCLGMQPDKLCWCAAIPNVNECTFDSECQTLYPNYCTGAP